LVEHFFYCIYSIFFAPEYSESTEYFPSVCSEVSEVSVAIIFDFFCPRITGKKINEDYISKKKGGEEKGK